jgi:hypothetical protein
MKKLSLLIALGSFVFLSIAKPAINVSQFETYSAQMQSMASKYIQEKKFDYAEKAISKWMDSYAQLSENEKESYHNIYADILYQQAVAFTQTNELFKALKSLKEAVKAGFNDQSLAQNDPNLEALKSYDEFNKILQSIKS